MAGFVGLWRTSGAATAGDAAALERARAATGGLGPVETRRPDVALAGTAPASEGLDGAAGAPFRLERPTDGGSLYLAPVPGGWAFASSVRALWATGFVAKEIDVAGAAALLWRGAPLDARLPVRHVRAVPPGGAALARAGSLTVVDPEPAPGPAAPDAVRQRLVERLQEASCLAVLTRGGVASLALLALLRDARSKPPEAHTLRWPAADPRGAAEVARAVRALGARHHDFVPSVPDVPAALADLLGSMDLPTSEAFPSALAAAAVASAGLDGAVSALGGGAVFATTDDFRDLARGERGAWRRSRPPRHEPHPLDLPAQRQVEHRAYARVALNQAQARFSFLPAGTRAALVRVGPRPSDGLFPRAASRVGIAAEVARRGVLADGHLREPSRLVRPYLDARALSLAQGLPEAVRFGRPGTGGLLGEWLRAAGGWPAPRPAEGFEGTLDGWLRGPLSPWAERALARDRLEAQGLLRADAVVDAVARWRARAPGGWTARHVFFLALVSAWLDREGLRVGAA